MKYRHSIFFAALSAAALYGLSSSARADEYLRADAYNDNVTSGNYLDLWAYEDYLVDGMLKRSGLEVTTSQINSDGSTEVVVAGGNHSVGSSGERGDILGGKRGQSVTSTNLTINGGYNIERIIGGNYGLGYVEGDRNIVINGGSANYIYGGDWYVGQRADSYNHPTLKKYIEGFYSEETYGVQSSTDVWTPKKSDGNINITVNGGEIGQIRGGHNCATGVIDPKVDIGYSLDEDGNVTVLRPYSVGGDVNIVLTGGTVGTGSGDAIRGAGGSGCSVDGNVNITVKGSAVVNGNIYAGARNVYAQVGGSCIKIEGGVVNGNVYGGGSWDTYSTRTLGDTEIHLTGGTINGSVYAAGDRDIVEGSTHVYFSGTGTALSEGSIVSGGGINDAEVQGTRYLHIGEPDVVTECTLTIADFDEVIIASGSTANLTNLTSPLARAGYVLDNVTLLTSSNSANNVITLNLNGIRTAKLTLAVQLTEGETELSDYTITLLGDGWATEDLPTELVFFNSLGEEIAASNIQLTSSTLSGESSFTISASVPEPASSALAVWGLSLLAMRRRRKH